MNTVCFLWISDQRIFGVDPRLVQGISTEKVSQAVTLITDVSRTRRNEYILENIPVFYCFF